ncbi:MAG: hypothetical protein WC744_02300 [Patescibacteria group bacterium]|jgi:hypothetical protein
MVEVTRTYLPIFNKIEGGMRFLRSHSLPYRSPIERTLWTGMDWTDRFALKKKKIWNGRAKDILNYINKSLENKKEFFEWFKKRSPEVQFFTLELLSIFSHENIAEIGKKSNLVREETNFNISTIQLTSDLYLALLEDSLIKNKTSKKSNEFLTNLDDLCISNLSKRKALISFIKLLQVNTSAEGELKNIFLVKKLILAYLNTIPNHYERYLFIQPYEEILKKIGIHISIKEVIYKRLVLGKYIIEHKEELVLN